MNQIIAKIDGLTNRIGNWVGWMTLFMVLLGAFNAVARYLGKWVGVHLSSNAYIEAQWYLFSLIFLLGAAHTLQRDEHVRAFLHALRRLLASAGHGEARRARPLLFHERHALADRGGARVGAGRDACISSGDASRVRHCGVCAEERA